MAKTVLGVDIGHDQLKLALVKGDRVLKTASAAMPENLLREGRVASRESMGELIRNTMRQNGLRAGRAAIVLPNEVVFVKNVEMPLMTVEQLEYNLPFEFNDYITGEVREFVFDYAVLSSPEDRPTAEEGAEEASNQMELLAVGANRSIVEDATQYLRKAGVKLTLAAPPISAYIALLRRQHLRLEASAEEYAILDLGFQGIRLYMFKQDKYLATRVLETGLNTLDNVLADAYSVDVHLAHTYLMTNFEGCQQREECRSAYEGIAVELMRALNFYRFSNPDSQLGDMWLCGGGAVIEPLVETIGDMLDIQLHTAEELVPGGESVNECNTYVQAIGIAMG